MTNVQCGTVRYYAILHTVALLSNLARTKKKHANYFPFRPSPPVLSFQLPAIPSNLYYSNVEPRQVEGTQETRLGNMNCNYFGCGSSSFRAPLSSKKFTLKNCCWRTQANKTSGFKLSLRFWWVATWLLVVSCSSGRRCEQATLFLWLLLKKKKVWLRNECRSVKNWNQ